MKERLPIKKLPFKFWRQNRLGSNDQGFTLVEIVMVVALVAIAAAMTIPNMLSSIPSWELNRAANDVYSNLQWARMVAIRENLRCRLTVDSTNNEYKIEKLDAAGNPISPPLKQIQISTMYENSGITISATGNIAFTPRGTSSGTSGIVTISNDQGRSYDFAISSAGRVKKE